MRVAHVIPGIARASGPSTFCVKVSDCLAQIGVGIDLFVGLLAKDSLLPQDKRVHVIEFGKAMRPAETPDLIHIHGLWLMSSRRAVVYAKKNRIPYVVSAHGMLAPWALQHKWLKKKIAWWLYQKRDLAGAAMFHVTAECETKWLRDLGFRQPCVLAPLGSDLPILTNAETLRRRDVKTVLFVGRIYPVKGLINLVRAWALVGSSKVLKCESSKVLKCESSEVGGAETIGNQQRAIGNGERRAAVGGEVTDNLACAYNSRTLELQNSKTIPWQLVIAGPDQAGHMGELIELCRQLNLTVDNLSEVEERLKVDAVRQSRAEIVFTGGVYGCTKDALYRSADLFVLPSFTENFGVVITDALAFGVPVITTKGTPWQELLGSPASSFVHDCESSLVEKHTGELSVSAGTGSDDSTFTNKLMNERTNELATSGRCGWWIDIGVDPLAEVLREAMSLTDEGRRAMGANGRRLVETKYTWPAVAAEMKRSYEWVLMGGELHARESRG